MKEIAPPWPSPLTGVLPVELFIDLPELSLTLRGKAQRDAQGRWHVRVPMPNLRIEFPTKAPGCLAHVRVGGEQQERQWRFQGGGYSQEGEAVYLYLRATGETG